MDDIEYAEEECPECGHKQWIPSNDLMTICEKCKKEYGTMIL